MKRLYIADDPGEAASHAGQSILHTEAYQLAVERGDIDEMGRLEREQELLIQEYARRWEQAVVDEGRELRVEVHPLTTSDASKREEWRNWNDPEGRELAIELHQAAHDRIGVDIQEDGTWNVTGG